MIIVQDSDKNIIDLCSTLKRFLLEWNDKGARAGSYDYVRKKLKQAETKMDIPTIKYKDFLLTKYKAKRGR